MSLSEVSVKMHIKGEFIFSVNCVTPFLRPQSLLFCPFRPSPSSQVSMTPVSHFLIKPRGKIRNSPERGSLWDNELACYGTVCFLCFLLTPAFFFICTPACADNGLCLISPNMESHHFICGYVKNFINPL